MGSGLNRPGNVGGGLQVSRREFSGAAQASPRKPPIHHGVWELHSPSWDIPISVQRWQVPKSNFTDEYRIFRELLRELRGERGVKQAELSSALGMPQSFVSKYEMGERRLDFVELAQICDYLNHPLESFVAAYRKATKATVARKSSKMKRGNRK